MMRRNAPRRAGSARRAGARLRELQRYRPRNRAELARFLSACLDIRVPSSPWNAKGPMGYLADAFFDKPGDAIVWANRGGGKTMLGAAATLLDLLFKPGIQVRILGGSMQQSERMYAHLRTLLDRPVLSKGGGVLATAPTQRRVILQNGSSVELLAGSQRSVRGTRVQVLRCDEVDEMKREVWSAAQLVTRSAVCGNRLVPGRVEALSTMHRVSGLMAELTRGDNRRLYKWDAIEVAARCPEALPCEGCILWDDCQGRAKQATGFIPIDDLISQRKRVSERMWEAEMMCRRPITREAVYPKFDPQAFVCASEPWLATVPLSPGVWYGGMDLGLRCPTVLLWAWATRRGLDTVLHIAGEYSAKERTIDDNLAEARGVANAHCLPTPERLDVLAVDPAGHQRSGQTGESDVAVLRRYGCAVSTPRAPLRLGIEAVLRRMDHGLLRIHPRCVQLIDALQAYRYDARQPNREEPVKDGPDHFCDALRYMVLAFDKRVSGIKTRVY